MFRTSKRCPEDAWSQRSSWCQICKAPGSRNQWCKAGQYRTGNCGGGQDNFYSCSDCTAPRSSDQWCSEGHYRTGSCGKTTNGYTCEAQPTCRDDQHLSGASKTEKGTCVAQPTCPDGQYLRADKPRVGKGVCAACANRMCATGKYRGGKCGGINEDGFQCLDQATCPAGTFYAQKPNEERACTACPVGTFRKESAHMETSCEKATATCPGDA